MNFAESYYKCAEHLFSAHSRKELALRFDAPIDLLYIHCLELQLKALWLEAGACDAKLLEYGHQLLKLYDDLRANTSTKAFIVAAERKCREEWKVFLRNARDRYREKLDNWITEEDGEGLGILTNQQIGDDLPELRETIRSLDGLHSSGGSELRYLKVGIRQVRVVRAFGLNERVDVRTLRWILPFVHQEFIARVSK